jgi:hypothetical protein
VKDYQARCLVNVSTGNISWQWDSGATDKTFNVVGSLTQNGKAVALAENLGTQVTYSFDSSTGTLSITTK